jgi:hypothetical protein
MNVSSIRDEDPQAHTDLRRGQPDPRRRVHRFDHVVDELLDLRSDFRNRRGRLVKELFAVSKNGPDHYEVNRQRRMVIP